MLFGTDLLEKIEDMDPKECKAMLLGLAAGIEISNELMEESIKLEELRKDRQDKQKPVSAHLNKYGYVYCPYKKVKLEFNNREDAEDVLDDIRTVLEEPETKHVTVWLLYSLVDLPLNPEMHKWGWYDLEDCRIERYEGKYVLRMPPADYIAS